MECSKDENNGELIFFYFFNAYLRLLLCIWPNIVTEEKFLILMRNYIEIDLSNFNKVKALGLFEWQLSLVCGL